jgi:hypothetical protein
LFRLTYSMQKYFFPLYVDEMWQWKISTRKVLKNRKLRTFFIGEVFWGLKFVWWKQEIGFFFGICSPLPIVDLTRGNN